MEVVAVQLRCEFSEEMDRDKVTAYPILGLGYRHMCERCYLQRCNTARLPHLRVFGRMLGGVAETGWMRGKGRQR